MNKINQTKENVEDILRGRNDMNRIVKDIIIIIISSLSPRDSEKFCAVLAILEDGTEETYWGQI